MKRINKNDNPLTEIDEKLSFENFQYKDFFEKIATLECDIENEKILVKGEFDKRYEDKINPVYLFVIKGFIQKVGSSTTTFKKRISSYNCGKKAYRNSGTCSTTNFFVLQSFLNIKEDIEVFAYFPEEKDVLINVLGNIVEKKLSMPSKEVEKKILTDLKEKGTMPILCTQT